MKNTVVVYDYDRTKRTLDLRDEWGRRTDQSPSLQRIPNGQGGFELELTTADGQKIHFDDEIMVRQLLAVSAQYFASICGQDRVNLSDSFRCSLHSG